MDTPVKRQSGKRPKKRKFTGNMHTRKTDALCVQSASQKKLSMDKVLPPKQKEEIPETFSGYRVFDLDVLCEAIQNNLVCKTCHTNVKLLEITRYGLSSKFELCCEMCSSVRVRSCTMLGSKKNIPEINRRFSYAMRLLGQGHAGMETFCSAMDLPPPVSEGPYNATVKHMLNATSDVAESFMKKAAQTEAILSNSSLCVTVSGDGTWKTRGHTSQTGVCAVIGVESGKVIDTEVLSTFCKGCHLANDSTVHKKYCLKNHSGSSGKMEVEGMIRIFSRSEEMRGLKYTSYLGDGDAKTFSAVCASKPYGPSVTLKKLECVGHVQKRMGTRLRKLKDINKKVKLNDGKPLSGKGRLTDKLINELSMYYGNAIREHKNSLTDMRKAIWAVYYHKLSSDEKPIHDFCPTTRETWCKYNQCMQSNESYTHKAPVPAVVMEKIKPIFLDLSQPSLLERCLGGKTQNSNESFNSLIWKFCPKSSGVCSRITKIATNEATIIFNEGCVGRHNVMDKLHLLRSKFSIEGFVKIDAKRIKNANRRALLQTKEQRKVRKQMKVNAYEANLKNEGEIYSCGAF